MQSSRVGLSIPGLIKPMLIQQNSILTFFKADFLQDFHKLVEAETTKHPRLWFWKAAIDPDAVRWHGMVGGDPSSGWFCKVLLACIETATAV